MDGNINVILQASVTVFGLDASIDLSLVGAPFSIRLSTGEPINLSDLWDKLSGTIEEYAGFGLPDLGAWSAISRSPIEVEPSLWIGPSGDDPSKTSFYLALDLVEPINIGGSIDIGGGVTVSITPNFSVWSLYIGYDAAAGGLGLRARVTTPTVSASGAPGEPKSQIVTYPFPVPAQDSSGAFKVHYLGIGQRVGPTVQVTANDPMEAIFEQLETQLTGDDPRTVLTTLAKTFYQPDRDWFIAADLEMRGFRVRVLFNDPAMYGLEISVASNSPTPFAGLLFEILYQKLSPDLGLYYGALTLPTAMRRIPMEGFILILPGFAIWVYTNGDFRVNVGWPLGDNSIGISFEVLIGRAAFYFAKLRSGDNPGAQSNVDYNPILAFGMGVSLSAGYAFNASIFSASINVSLSATFQGLLAWKSGNEIYAPPDHYWFAATAGLSVLIQGSVDFSIIRASVTISFTANVGVAFETGYATFITVAAEVEVDVGIKIVFFTIHLSFHTSVSTQFTIGSGAPASVNGPLAPGLAIPGGYGVMTPVQLQAVELVERMVARRPSARLRGRAAPPREPADHRSLPGAPLRSDRASHPGPALQTSPPAQIDLHFLLQPTATYDSGGAGQFATIASLVTDCPGPGSSPDASPGDTSFERLVRAMVEWLMGYAHGAKVSDQLSALAAALGHGADAPFGDWQVFETRLRQFLQTGCTFTIAGVLAPDPQAEQAPGVDAAVMPLFDVLRFTRPDGAVVDVDSYGPAPASYPLALEYYFQDLAGMAAAANVAIRERAASSANGSPTERGIGSFLFLDYFLMQARNAVNTLLQAAIAYEKAHQDQLLDAVQAAEGDGSFTLAGLAADYVDRISGEDELGALLDAFDYGSAAGIGSRFMLGGLQLLVPADVPAVPTRQNVAGLPTAPLYILTGQQCPSPAGTLAQATLSLNPDTTLPSIPITFTGSPANAAAASFGLPAVVPDSPSPSWSGVVPPTTGGDGSLQVAWLPGVTTQPLYIGLKSQVGWERPGGVATLMPLPDSIQALLAARGGLALAVTAEPPPQGNSARARAASQAATPVAAASALRIRLSLTQVPAPSAGAVSASDSPTPGSPGANAAAQQYLPHIYQIGGTDEATRDLIHMALQGDLTGARISLLYPQSETGSPGRGGSPSGASTVMRSDVLSPDVLLAKTNLSTLNQIPETSRVFALQAELTAAAGADLAPIADVPAVLRLVWELSVVNAPGYFLFYLGENGSDLPASIFSSAGVNGGQTAELDMVVEWDAGAAPTVLPAFANAIVVNGPASPDQLYAGVLDTAGAPVLGASPTYPAGSLAVAVTWDRPDDERPAPVDALYHLLQYAIADQGPYEGSAWSLPMGPTTNGLPASVAAAASPDTSQYVQSIPAAGLLRQPSGPANRYAIIDQPITAELRILDIYGNPLPDSHTTSQTPLYQDPLISLGEWPGLFTSYTVTPSSDASARLTVAMHFDPDAIVPPNGSPTSGIAPGRAREAWTSALQRYELIADQLADPNTTAQLSTTLGASADIKDRLLAAARQIAANISTALAAVTSPDEPVVTPYDDPIGIDIAFAGLVALTDTVTSLLVGVSLSRPPGLVDPDAVRAMPASVSVAYGVHPDLAGAAASPGAIGNIMAFAQPFEAAFQGFDGADGCIKLAQRAGVSVAADAGGAPALFFMRWSSANGVKVTFGDALVFFALAPLSTKPMAGQADGQTWANVDPDAWARDFLVAFDAFMAPALAVAIGVLDLREGTGFYERLVQAKLDLAGAIKLGVTTLFEEQAGLGDLTAAQARYEQAMLTALASAFTVTTAVQAPVTVTAAGTPDPGSPAVAPRLYGAIGAPQASPPTTGRTSPYTLSAGNLELSPGDNWMTSLLTVAHPGLQTELTLPLDYQVSYLQHQFEPDEAFLGYVPSSWLKFALPAAAPLQMPISAEASLPIPLIFQPVTPTLARQAAAAAPLASPQGGQSTAEEIAAAMRWVYSAELALSVDSQDTLYFDATYNDADAAAVRALRASADPLQDLVNALGAFRVWYAAASPQFGAITQAALPTAPLAPAPPSPAVASALVEAFADHAAAVAAAWQALHAVGRARLLALEETTDHFRLTAERYGGGSPGSIVVLEGRNDAGGPPQVWPTLATADGQTWTPSGSPAGSPTAEGWTAVSHTFPQTPDLSTLQLQFGPLQIVDRQSATLAAWIVRNANLSPGMTTKQAFVYTTQTASFPNAIIPLIHRGALQVDPAASLLETLIEILEPVAQVGVGLAPSLRLSAVYSYAVAPGSELMVQTAVALVRDAALASPDALARAAADVLSEWFFWTGPSTQSATLTLTLTVFGTTGDAALPLVQFDGIVIPTGAQDDDWWRSGPP